MSPDADDRAQIDADAVAQHAFTKVRKGYDTDEVRAFLVGLASEIRDLQRVHDDLSRRLVEVERRAADPRELDEEQVTQLLGEETARVLVDARKAATEIRTKADDDATSARNAANEEASQTRAAAEQYAESVRTLADEGEAKIRADADAYATSLRETADRETAEQRTAADTYATETRDAADREVAEQRTAAQTEVDELTERARTVLDERTSEAETAATSIRTDADAYDTRVRGEADTYAATTRGDADTYRDETRSAAETHRDETKADADRIRQEADEAAAARGTEADERYETRVAEGEAEAQRLVDEAREQGRGMVQEAREYRERVIADLAERRRAARDELDRVGKTRDAMAVALTDVVTQIERSHRSLQDVSIDPATVADRGADRRFLEVDESAIGVGVGEVPGDETEADTGEAEVDDIEVAVDESTDVEAEEDEGDDTDPDEDLDDAPPVWSDDEDDLGGGDPAAADLTDDEDIDDLIAATDPDDETDGDAPAGASEGEGDDADAFDVGGGDPAGADVTNDEDIDELTDTTVIDLTDDEPGTPPGIDDLFARIRAEREGGDEPTEAVAAVAVVEADAADDAEEPETEGDDDPVDASEASEDEALLDRRDATTDELERQLARRLKRVLSDEQNEALHTLRGVKGAPVAEEVLLSEDAHRERYRTALLEDLQAAERAGAAFFGDAPARSADVVDIADELSADLVRQVRGRLERAFDGADDPEDVADGIRTLYREWKTQRIAESARHFVITAFARGVAESAPDGATFRWLVDHNGAAAPDCDDNALAGEVPKGEPFPTGDLCPPVHPGCRCLAVRIEA